MLQIKILMKMKRFLTLLFVAFCFVANAQTYYPLVDTGKVWNFKSTGCDPTKYSTYSEKLEGDTIIDSKNYKKVYGSYNEYNTEWVNFLFIREDIATKKVYLRQGINENLLYDFSLQLNDTFKTLYNENDGYRCIQTVLKVDSIKIYNHFRKRLWMSIMDSNDTSDCEQWIEGIGSVRGFPAVCVSGMLGGYSELLCYHENDTMFYQNPIYNSCYMNNTGITEFEKPKIEIFYADKFLNITFNEKAEYKLVVYDIIGNSIFSKQIKSSEKINLENYNLKQGIYLYSVSNNNSIIEKKKIIYLK